MEENSNNTILDKIKQILGEGSPTVNSYLDLKGTDTANDSGYLSNVSTKEATPNLNEVEAPLITEEDSLTSHINQQFAKPKVQNTTTPNIPVQNINTPSLDVSSPALTTPAPVQDNKPATTSQPPVTVNVTVSDSKDKKDNQQPVTITPPAVPANNDINNIEQTSSTVNNFLEKITKLENTESKLTTILQQNTFNNVTDVDSEQNKNINNTFNNFNKTATAENSYLNNQKTTVENNLNSQTKNNIDNSVTQNKEENISSIVNNIVSKNNTSLLNNIDNIVNNHNAINNINSKTDNTSINQSSTVNNFDNRSTTGNNIDNVTNNNNVNNLSKIESTPAPDNANLSDVKQTSIDDVYKSVQQNSSYLLALASAILNLTNNINKIGNNPAPSSPAAVPIAIPVAAGNDGGTTTDLEKTDFVGRIPGIRGDFLRRTY